MVASFMELLSQRYHGKLDETGRPLHRLRRHGVVRMKQLINDLLEYLARGHARQAVRAPADCARHRAQP